MKKILILLCISIAAPNLFGQSDVETPNGVPNPRTPREIRNDDFQRRRANMDYLIGLKPERSRKRRKYSSAELKKIRLATRVHKEDKIKYKSFLKKKNTGIFRLLPDFNCETDNLIKVDGDCKNFVPGRWSYSFRLKDYTHRVFHDLIFKRDRLITDSLLNQGILVSLGDRAIEDISLQSPGLEFLVNFKPENERNGAKQQYREISRSIEKDGFIYSNIVKIGNNTTYALRVIAYGYKDKWDTRLWPKHIEKANEEERKFAGLKYDKRNDSIYVFRTIRQSEDGGVTILWKQLKKTKSAKLLYQKDERLKDFKK